MKVVHSQSTTKNIFLIVAFVILLTEYFLIIKWSSHFHGWFKSYWLLLSRINNFFNLLSLLNAANLAFITLLISDLEFFTQVLQAFLVTPFTFSLISCWELIVLVGHCTIFLILLQGFIQLLYLYFLSTKKHFLVQVKFVIT